MGEMSFLPLSSTSSYSLIICHNTPPPPIWLIVGRRDPNLLPGFASSDLLLRRSLLLSRLGLIGARPL